MVFPVQTRMFARLNFFKVTLRSMWKDTGEIAEELGVSENRVSRYVRYNTHFLGVHTPYLLYNVADIKWLGTEGERHQGWGAGAGISYGYSWLLSRHWNLEATVGVGYLYLKSDKYPCANCGRKQEGIKKHYFGPTQAAINLIYQF